MVFGLLPRGGASDFQDAGLISRGAQGHGPVHLLLTSADEEGFAWDAGERGWVRPPLPPRRMMTGPIQHFCSSLLDAWERRISAQLAEKGGLSVSRVC